MISTDKKIVFYDLETTGTDPQKCEIVQIACKVLEAGVAYEDAFTYSTLVKPLKPIPSDSTKVHGISDSDVKDAPTFQEIAEKIGEIFSADALIAGYNNSQYDDLILDRYMSYYLKRELIDDTYSSRVFDVLSLNRKLYSHKLGDTYQRFTGQSLENAHDANADVDATILVADHILRDNNLLGITFEEVRDICFAGTADFAGKFYFDEENTLRYNFGQHKGKDVKNFQSYNDWIFNSSVPSQSKTVLRNYLESIK